MGCNYYIIDSAYGNKSRYNIKDDSGKSLFYYCISDDDNNKFELFDLENNELILTTCSVNDFEFQNIVYPMIKEEKFLIYLKIITLQV
ncbi:MAG: hypothetical protein E6423_03515 [Clostridium sp.]|nr:hypothetical protein [Clostridium sp.]